MEEMPRARCGGGARVSSPSPGSPLTRFFPRSPT